MSTYDHAPFIRTRITENTIKVERLVALSGCVIISAWLYGVRAAILCLVAIIVAFFCSLLASYTKKNKGHADISDIISAILLALLCPATINYFILALAVAVMILCIKLPVGFLINRGLHINVAAAAWLFLAIVFQNQMFSYPSLAVDGPISLAIKPVFTVVKSAALILKEGKIPSGGAISILAGELVGPMGSTAFIVLLSCFAYLILRENNSWKVTISMVASSFLFSLLFPRAGYNVFTTAFYEIVSGSLMLCAVFLATDSGMFPKAKRAKWLYGAVLGIITMSIRYFTPFEQGAPIAILICSLFIDYFDFFVYKLQFFRKYLRVYLKSKKYKWSIRKSTVVNQKLKNI